MYLFHFLWWMHNAAQQSRGCPSLSLSPCTTHTCAFCAGVFRSALIYPLEIRREKIKRAMRARRAAGLAAAVDSPRIQKRKIMWRGAMITQTPEYVITANNRRIVYVNTFICLSLSLSLADAFVLYVCVCAGWLDGFYSLFLAVYVLSDPSRRVWLL